jgi:hypothetical protein
MKTLLIMLACCGLVLGCDYTVPLVTTPGIEIDKSVLGLWQTTTEDGKTEQLLVLPLDKNEFLVSYPANTNEGLFARACLCRTGDKTLVQLKWFGTAEGKLPDDNRVFQFASYTVTSDKLTVRLLNTDVVDKDVASTRELAKSIAANKDNTNLFKKAAVFMKVNK